jgi:hypothetical protein
VRWAVQFPNPLDGSGSRVKSLSAAPLTSCAPAGALVFGAGKGGYSGCSKSKREMDEAAPLKGPWTLHESGGPAGPGWGSEAIWSGAQAWPRRPSRLRQTS